MEAAGEGDVDEAWRVWSQVAQQSFLEHLPEGEKQEPYLGHGEVRISTIGQKPREEAAPRQANDKAVAQLAMREACLRRQAARLRMLATMTEACRSTAIASWRKEHRATWGAYCRAQ